MKDNARTFFLVAIISTVAFSAIGSLYGFQSYLTKALEDSSPYTIHYTPWLDDSESVVEQDINKVNAILKEENVEAERAKFELTYFAHSEWKNDVLIVRESEYNWLAEMIGEKKVQPDQKEAIVVGFIPGGLGEKPSEDDVLMDFPLSLENEEAVQPVKVIHSQVYPVYHSFYVVDDQTYEKLGTPIRTETNAVWQAQEGQTDQVLEAGRKLSEQLEHRAYAIDYNMYEINKAYGPILFIGLFIGIVFFVSAGSFLYFRLFTDLDEEKQKFRSIAKIGLKESELKKVVNRQVALLFFSPIVVALIHGAVALTALSHFFDYNLTIEALLVLGSFAVIQLVYFTIVRFFYVKQVKRAIL